MPIIIQIDDHDLDGFTDEAKVILRQDVEKNCRDIILEAGRLEAGFRSHQSSRIEINRIIIESAISAQRNPFRKRKSKKTVCYQIGSMVALFIAGIVFNVEDFQKNLWLLGLFIFLSIAGILCGIMNIMSEGE